MPIFAAVFVLIAIVLGLVFVIGGIRRWNGVIDPPEGTEFYHPLSFWRAVLPQKMMPRAAVLLGLSWIAAGIFVIVVSIS